MFILINVDKTLIKFLQFFKLKTLNEAIIREESNPQTPNGSLSSKTNINSLKDKGIIIKL